MKKILFFPIYHKKKILCFPIYHKKKILCFPIYHKKKILCFPIYHKKKILFLPIYKEKKLLTPNIKDFYIINHKEQFQTIEIYNKQDIDIDIISNLKLYMLDMLDEILYSLEQQTKLSASILINITFKTPEISQGSFKINIIKECNTPTYKTIDIILKRINELIEYYNIQKFIKVHIKIMYDK
jgi:hypothetical protein